MAHSLKDEARPSPDIEKMSADISDTTKDEPPLPEYPSGMKVGLIMASCLLAMFLVALDRTIIATAIPRITDDFHSLSDIGWYGSAYMLTNSGVQLLFGRIYKFYSTKWVFLTSITIFEIGSLLCGVAPSSKVLIIGRAVAGVGSAGCLSGVILIMTRTVPLHKRPLYSGMFGAMFGIASILGPLLGGVFTEDVSWRWCFYINLPIGAVTILVISIILKLPALPTKALTFRQQLELLDPIGTLCFLPSITCLILALQWGGTKYEWSDGRVIGLLVVFAILFLSFIAVQIWKGEGATIPPRIISQRSIAFGFFCTICAGATMMIVIYYLPIYFQAIKNTTAVQSGIRTIPLVLSLVAGSMMAGVFTSRVGYYTAPLLLSAIFAPIGAGLLTTLTVSTGHAKWIGYQVICGYGLGLGMQQPNMAAQTVLSQSDVSIGVAIMFFAQQLSGAIFIAVGQNLFTQKLEKNLAGTPGLNVQAILNTGATQLRDVVAPQFLQGVLVAYNNALRQTFVVACAMASILILGAIGMEWKSVKKDKIKKVVDREAAEEAAEEPRQKSGERTRGTEVEVTQAKAAEVAATQTTAA